VEYFDATLVIYTRITVWNMPAYVCS